MEVLLQFNFSTSILEGLLQSLGISLRHTFLQDAGSAVNHFLCFLQTETASFLDSLNDLQLGSTCTLEDNVEVSLFLGSSACTFTTSSYNNSSSSGLDAISFLKFILKINYFLYCERHELSSNSLNISHFFNVFKLLLFLVITQLQQLPLASLRDFPERSGRS